MRCFLVSRGAKPPINEINHDIYTSRLVVYSIGHSIAKLFVKCRVPKEWNWEGLRWGAGGVGDAETLKGSPKSLELQYFAHLGASVLLRLLERRSVWGGRAHLFV